MGLKARQAKLITTEDTVILTEHPELDLKTIRRRVGLYMLKPPVSSELSANGKHWRILWPQDVGIPTTKLEKRIKLFVSEDGVLWEPTLEIPKKNDEEYPFNYFCRQRQPITRMLKMQAGHNWANKIIGPTEFIEDLEECARRWNKGERCKEFRFDVRADV